MTSIYTVQPTGIGRRGHYAASVHGTEGTAMPYGAQIVSLWSAAFSWPDNQKPIYIVKILGHSGTNPEGVADQIRVAQARGFHVCLQIRDDEPAGRDATVAIQLASGVLDLLRDSFDLVPDSLEYLNEPEFNNPGMSDAANAQLMAAVYWGVRDKVPQFALGGFASWQMLPKQLQSQIDAMPSQLRSRIAFVGTHHYDGQPSLPAEHGYLDLIHGMLPNVPLAMSEGDIFATGIGGHDEDIWDHKGASFSVDHNLTLAYEGIYCCDFTIQTEAQGAQGNGFFRANGQPHPSGEAMLQIVGPFTQTAMVQVTRKTGWDSSSVFSNATGGLVITNHVADTEQTCKKWMNMSAKGAATEHIVWRQVWAWLRGLLPQPSYRLKWEPDWDALEARYAQALVDELSPIKTVLIRLPLSFEGIDIIAKVDDGGVAPHIQILGRLVIATMPRNSAVYAQVR